MVARFTPTALGGDYFPARNANNKFVSSGCTLLDQILGGGWLLGRVSNIIGDKSVGKTLLAIEACRNFHDAYGQKPHYRESEGAFDLPYAESIGLPEGGVDFGKNGVDTRWDTIDQIYVDLEDRLGVLSGKKNARAFYVLDSVDSFTTKADLKRDLSKTGAFNTKKAVLLSNMFSQHSRGIRQANMHLMLISQVRSNIGVMFGAKYTRSGGKALDFYSSQIVYLAEVDRVFKTIKGVRRQIGVIVRAKCTKNKVAIPHRECEFMLRYGYGVDDLYGNAVWLLEVGRAQEIGLRNKKSEKERATEVNSFMRSCERLSDEKYRTESAEVSTIVTRVWHEVEAEFAPKRRKYA